MLAWVETVEGGKIDVPNVPTMLVTRAGLRAEPHGSMIIRRETPRPPEPWDSNVVRAAFPFARPQALPVRTPIRRGAVCDVSLEISRRLANYLLVMPLSMKTIT